MELKKLMEHISIIPLQISSGREHKLSGILLLDYFAVISVQKVEDIEDFLEYISIS